MRNTYCAITAAIIVAATPRLLLADAPAAPPPAVPALSDLLTGWGLTVSGDVAASYYHSNRYPSDSDFGTREFDNNHDSFQLDEAGLQIGYQPKSGIGAFVDFIAGTDAQILNGSEGSSGSSVDLRQGYLQYVTGPLTVIAGKFVTLAGAEVINPSQNTNFSRGLLFTDLEPLTHTGFRATYAVTDTVNVILGLNNGWNNTQGEFNETAEGSKTVETGANWTPNKLVSLALVGYFGKTSSDFEGGIDTSLLDFVGTFNVTSALTLILNADFYQLSGPGTHEEDGGGSHADGFAAYANYAISDTWRVSVRAEYLDFLTVGHISEATATVGYSPVKNFEIRGELRYDVSEKGQPIFPNSFDDDEDVPPANSNLEVAVQGVYKFNLP